MLAAASKDDIRYYLQGAYIDLDRERLVGSDGNILVSVPIRIDQREPDDMRLSESRQLIIPAPDRQPPLSVDRVEIEVTGYQVEFRYIGKHVVSYRGTLIEATYPDYQRVLCGNESAQIDRIRFNPDILARISKALHNKSVACMVNTHADGMKFNVTFSNNPDLVCTFMGCRG